MLNFLDFLEGYEFIYAGIAMLLVLIISLSLHELGHAYVAYKQGDMTPKYQGRVTLNPLAHIDPIGFLCCALFGFGWAKPVEINPLKFRNYKSGIFKVSIAGVTANLILSFIGCMLLHLTYRVGIYANWFCHFLYYFSMFLYYINLSLFVFNLLPIYPLDGFNCITAYAKYENGYVRFMRKYGYIILLLVVTIGDTLLFTLVNWVGVPMELFWGLVFGI